MLIGRERQLAYVRRARVAVLAGEPGIGKTTLLRAACEQAVCDGYTVFRGGGCAAERGVPYGVFLDALPQGRRTPLDAGRRTGIEEAAAWLRQVLAGRTLLALDDLHLADDPSLALLDDLSRDPPCRLLLVHRDGALPGERLDLEPLTVADALTMGCDAAAHARALGVPLYLRILHDGGDARAAVEPELATLSPVELRVLHAAAVAGDRFDAPLLAEIADVPLPATRAALTTLLHESLVRPAPRDPASGEEVLVHRHPLVREALYDRCGPGWRFGAHVRALAVLEERGAPAHVLAPHVERTAAAGDIRAAAILTEAAADADPAPAVRLLEAAIRIAPDPAREVRLAAGLAATGRLREARDRLHRTIGVLPPGPLRAEAVEGCAMVERLLGRHAEALALLAAEPDPTLPLRVEAAVAHLMGDLPCTPWPLDDAALAAARSQPDPGLLASALALRALDDAAHATITSTTLAHAVEAAALLTREGAGSTRVGAWLWTGVAALVLGRMDDADELLRRAGELARRTGQRHLVSHIRYFAGLAGLRLGQMEEAASAFAEALEAARETGSPDLVCIALAGRAQALAWKGEAAAAAALAEEAVEAARGRRSLPASLAIGMVALTRRLMGDPAGCADLLMAWGGGPELPGFCMLHRVDWLTVLAEAQAAAARSGAADTAGVLGRAAQAETAAGQAVQLARRSGVGRQVDLAEFARACALKGAAPWWAARVAVEAAESFERRGDVPYAAWARILAGSALADAGEAGTARRELEYGRALAAASGARTLIEAAARELRRTGTAVPLDPRELQITHLVRAGLTNKQIAHRLYLSPRTIEAALTRIFAKLGVSSRAGVAAALTTQRSA
ncbi:helix-turn-helix transcriptional regulator [Nonomuraea sediminis]|uniref:helix-turn-helix transcriptional regulator n=1 Tax=Nonomuraea sediminis TaxID=2835864 RepID=UPI001BDC23EE|nr:LuxR family transcriptional regulator [Nonomuraea sediminis]